MPARRDEERIARARELYAGGMTAAEVAAGIGADERTVRGWLAGELRRTGPRKLPVPDSKIRELHDRGESFAAIAKLTGMSATAVRMRYYAITGRERPERGRR